MTDYVTNENGKGSNDNRRRSLKNGVGYFIGGFFDGDGPVLLPPDTVGSDEDTDWSYDEETENEEAYVYQAPEGGEEGHVIHESDVKLPPDLAALTSKMKKLNLQEIEAINKESGIFSIPLAELEVPISTIADLALSLVKNLDPLLVWQLVRKGDSDISTTILHPILHEQFMPAMRSQGNFSTATLKKLKHALLETLVLFFKDAYELRDNSTPLRDHSRFASWVARTIQNQVRKILARGRIKHNRTIFVLAEKIHKNRRDQYASPTRHLEELTDLNPRRKTEVFMNGVIERQRSGSMHGACRADDNKMITQLEVRFERILQIRRGDRRRVQEFFEEHEDESACDLLDVLDECLDVRQSALYNDAFRRKMHYSARGHNICFLCDHLQEIKDELHQQDEAHLGHGQFYLQ